MKPKSWIGFIFATVLVVFNSCSFSAKVSKEYFQKAKLEHYDVIIVPGVPFEGETWSRTMKLRVYWSKYLYEAGIARNIIFSGSAVYSPYYEGKIMAQYANALGIPAAHIFSETKAEHSTENVYYSWKLAKKLGFKNIALASDQFQTKQLRRFIEKKVDPSIDLIPFVTDTLEMMYPGMMTPAIDYEQSGMKRFISLKKREGFRKRWRGTRGLNIDKDAD
ncbi:MAG TPA: YdcF family protein [Chryseolinea sp.]|nr:YdcF family protein [Chryseolinea sp.]